MQCSVLFWLLLGLPSTPTLGQTFKKGNLSPEQLWNGASLIVGGTVHDLTDAGDAYLQGTLSVEVVYKGSIPHNELIVRIYGPSEVPGRSALWLFRGARDGIPTESYPWFRGGPELFLLWPSTLRERVLAKLDYASSDVDDDVQLFVIRAPGAKDGAVAVWIALVYSPRSASPRKHLSFASPARLTVRGPGGKSVGSALQVPKRPQASSGLGSVFVVVPKGDPVLQQVVVSRTPLHGKHEIKVDVALISQTKVQLSASLILSD